MDTAIAAEAHAKLEQAIAKTIGQTTTAIARIQRDVPRDAIVVANKLKFNHAGPAGLQMVAGGQSWGIHKHALGQIAGQAGVPFDYVQTLSEGEEWQQQLLENVFDETFQHSPDRHLIRAVEVDGGLQARGFLSDRFRRLDSRPHLDTFIEEVRKFGAQPYAGVATDTRVSLKALLPTPWIFEVPQGPMRSDHRGHTGIEAVAFGIEWRNSDYGTSRNNLAVFLLRLWCFNGAVLEDVMKQIHLGGRLEESIEFSTKTYELDTRASVSAMRDVIRGFFEPKKVKATIERVEALAQKEISWDKVKGQLHKAVSKEELRKITEAYEGPDVTNLPPGDTAWRASNAISWIANATDNAERKLELEKLAGTFLKAA